jgi:hypothetical protein
VRIQVRGIRSGGGYSSLGLCLRGCVIYAGIVVGNNQIIAHRVTNRARRRPGWASNWINQDANPRSRQESSLLGPQYPSIPQGVRELSGLGAWKQKQTRKSAGAQTHCRASRSQATGSHRRDDLSHRSSTQEPQRSSWLDDRR